jgi:hypothetical protein
MAGEDWTPPGGSTHVFRVPTYDDAADAPNAFKEFATSIDGGLGLDFEADREGQVVQSLDGVDWAAGMALTVSETVPDDSVGEIGDVVFVTGDDDLKGSGAGSAVVSMNSVGVDNNPDGKPAGAIDLSDGSYTYTDGSETYRVFAFTDDTNSNLTLDVETAGFVDALIVGGGGGGGREWAGGGGAGGHYYLANAYLEKGSLTVTVGAGGAGASISSFGNNGIASRIGSYFSPGGGGGADTSGTAGNESNFGLSGGSGGGASGFASGSSAAGGAGITGLGNSGGTGAGFFGGGGGGAGGAGGNSTGSAGGVGGAGAENSIAGESVTRAGGGGGRNGAGTDGGGTGGDAGASGTANTGSGGGGGNASAGKGGSGIVIVRVKV